MSVVAWPASYTCYDLAIGVRDSGRGRHVRMGSSAISVAGWRENGWTILFDRDTVWAYAYSSIPNPGPLIPNPGFTEMGISDDTHWIGSTRHELGFGTILVGRQSSPDWESRLGIMFPIWPASVAAAVVLLFQMRRWLRQRKRFQSGACLKCSYDLRAHKSGDKCPECGMVNTPRGASL